MNAAFMAASARQFDEAERLAGEAVAIGERILPAQTDPFAAQLNQIRQMKAAPEAQTRTAP